MSDIIADCFIFWSYLGKWVSEEATLGEEVAGLVRKRRRVAIVTSDLLGPVRNGGIGTAYAALAELLARAGDDVSVVYVREDKCDDHDIDHWIRHYRARNIALISLKSSRPTFEVSGLELRRSHLVYEWLRDRDGDFDVVHFPDWKGLGYFTALGKHQLLAFREMTIVVGLHSPSLWSDVGNGRSDHPVAALELDHMERRTLELADIAVSPSHYLIDWLRGRGWKLPAATHVIPNVVVSEPKQPSVPLGLAPLNEIVFFGRLEQRKGLDLFCQAVTQLLQLGHLSNVKITFLGKISKVGSQRSDRWIGERAASWEVPWQILDRYGSAEALEYLTGPGRVAVISSLVDNSPYTVMECLHRGIPFIASRVGGIPELVHAADVNAVCFLPTVSGLAEALSGVAKVGVKPARPGYDRVHSIARWLDLHSGQPAGRKAAPTSLPLVSVCIAHKDRPDYLLEACASLAAQTYPNFEVVIVDDGSVEPTTLAALDQIESTYAPRGWRLLRQPSRGEAAARNAAAAVARGKYLLLVDDDNLARPFEIAMFVTAAEASGADVLTCIVESFYSERPPVDGVPERRWIPVGGALLPGTIRNCFGDTNSLVRTELFRRVGGFRDEFGNFSKDWDFFLRAILAGARLDVVPEPLYWYRRHAAAQSRTRNIAAAHQHILQMLVEHAQPELWQLAMVAQSFSRRDGQLSVAPSARLIQSLATLAAFALAHPTVAVREKLPVFLSILQTRGLRHALRATREFARNNHIVR